MNITFKKAISLFAAGTMLVSTFGSVAALAANELYTTHLWETMENGSSANISGNTGNGGAEISFDATGKYGKGLTLTKKASDLAIQKYPSLTVMLNNTITLQNAIANNLTVEVEFDLYGKNLGTTDNYIMLSSEEEPTPKSGNDVQISFEAGGKMKIYETSGNTSTNVQQILAASNYTISDFNTFKFVMHGDSTTNSWMLDSFSLNGEAKYTKEKSIGVCDFSKLYFRFKSKANEGGEIGLDNVSVTSYTTPADGVSPVPNRHTYMDTVTTTYASKVGTGAYNNALSVFEQDYITEADMNQAYYILEGRSDLYVIEDIYNSSRSVKITSNDLIGGTPILIVASFVSDKLDDIMIKTLDPIASGSNTTINFDEDFTYPSNASLRAYIFEAIETLLPLAAARVE